jgi:lysophospholipase L1-like esterase
MAKHLLALLCWLALSCAQAAAQPLQDFGDPQAAQLWEQFRDLESGKKRDALRLMQLGDSHTAGDYFTGQLRDYLQARYGNAGIGWLTPGYIDNQRSAQMKLQNQGRWQLSDSKQPSHYGLFPLGGLFNQALSSSRLLFSSKDPLAPGAWQIHAWLQAGQGVWRLSLASGESERLLPSRDRHSQWSLVSLRTSAVQLQSFSLLAPGGAAIGGLALDRQSPGVVLDALGINGAKGNVVLRWDSASLRKQLQWRSPKLVIIAFGTNEAFDLKFDPQEFARDLRDLVRHLRFHAPGAALLILSAPSSAKSKPPHLTGLCPQGLPRGLMEIWRLQKRIAQEERTLFWDWGAFMGGACGAQQWSQRAPALMGKDLIHLSREGYQASAEGLFAALQGQIRP